MNAVASFYGRNSQIGIIKKTAKKFFSDHDQESLDIGRSGMPPAIQTGGAAGKHRKNPTSQSSWHSLGPTDRPGNRRADGTVTLFHLSKEIGQA